MSVPRLDLSLAHEIILNCEGGYVQFLMHGRLFPVQLPVDRNTRNEILSMIPTPVNQHFSPDMRIEVGKGVLEFRDTWTKKVVKQYSCLEDPVTQWWIGVTRLIRGSKKHLLPPYDKDDFDIQTQFDNKSYNEDLSCKWVERSVYLYVVDVREGFGFEL